MRRSVEAAGYLGLALLGAAAVVQVTVLDAAPVALGLAVAGVVSLIVYAFIAGRSIQGFLGRRSTREGGGAAGTTIFVVGTLILVNLLAARFPASRDMTADRLFTLAPETVSVLEAAPEPPRVWVFHREGSLQQIQLESLLEAGKRAAPRLEYSVVDPERDPATAFRFGLDRFASVVVVGEREIVFDGFDEEALATAIRRASRVRQPAVSYLRGHGESFPNDQDPRGAFEAGSLLHRRGYRVFGMDLLRGGERIADSTDALIIAGPQTPLTDPEMERVLDYFLAGGRLLVLLDPAHGVDLAPLLAAAGLAFRTDFLIDPDQREEQVLVPADFSGHPVVRILRERLVTPIFPGVGEIERFQRPGVRNAALLWSGPRARAATEPGAQGRRRAILVAAERATPGDGPPGRMVVVGDSDFATNAMVHTLANGDLFLSAVQWLVEDQETVAIRPREPTNRPVVVSRQQGRALMVILVGLLPLAVLGAGALTWWRRR